MAGDRSASSRGASRWRRVLQLVLLLAIIVTAIGADAYFELRQPLNLPQAGIVEIRSGETLRAVMAKLVADGTLNWRQGLFLNIWARVSRPASAIRAGEYSPAQGTTSLGLLRLLRSGKVVLHEIRFIEGWRFEQAWRLLAQDPYVEHTIASDDGVALMRALGEASVSPEGQFFPDTYLFARGTTDIAIMRQAFQAMNKRLGEAWATRAPGLPYASPQEALIMASLIEKEGRVDVERARIAGVFVRRLELPMRLQTDPSVIYGIGARYDGNLRTIDLRTDTPYNTYTRDGLPPTPICMPGEASLQAALHPAAGDALYFVARGDGTHQFSATLDEHNAAVQRYQLGGGPGGGSDGAPGGRNGK